MMSYVIENLYLGDIDDAMRSFDLKQQKGVTHILTIDSKPLTLDAREGFVYLHVFALDDENFDLLRELDTCIQFIDDGRNSGAVLVHCWAGQSRSGTVVLAYVMKHLDLSLTEADELVRCQCPAVRPNDGFLRQLELYQSMGCRVDLTFPAYRNYRLELLAEQMQQDYRNVEARCQSDLNVTSVSGRADRQLPYCPGGHISNVCLNDQVPLDCLAEDPSTASAAATDDAVYRCAKCRRPLFRQSGVMNHEPLHGGGKQQVKGQRSAEKKGFHGAGNACDVFIEPVKWMADVILTIEGKLCCPKCSAKIGSFNWAGERCPCGTWVTPAFHVQKAKVDVCRTPAVAMVMSSPKSGSIAVNSPTCSKQTVNCNMPDVALLPVSSPDGLAK